MTKQAILHYTDILKVYDMYRIRSLLTILKILEDNGEGVVINWQVWRNWWQVALEIETTIIILFSEEYCKKIPHRLFR